MKRDDTTYLQHIVDAIAKTEAYLENVDEATFNRNTLIQDAVIRQIEIIGEAAKHLSRPLRKKYQFVPWSDMAGMRDKLIHAYFGVDITQVWLTATDDLPQLKPVLEEIIKELRTAAVD